VLTGDLDRLLAAEIGALRPLPAITTAGTWQPAPPGSPPAPGGAPAPGTYATPVAFRLGRDPGRTAATLATALRRADWVGAAAVTGGYVTVTVTPDALARLAVRITEAGAACARSTALAGTAIPAPPAPDLAAAAGWADARRHLAAFLTGRLAEAAGARTFPSDHEERGAVPARRPGQATGPVAAAIDFAGAGAVRYALARLRPGAPASVDPCHAAAHHLGVPAYAVRYAHAHAASALRQAADLGLSLGEAADFQPRLLAHPSERALLDELSWLAERVAGATRRARPDVFARYLERLAGAYFDCQEQCPAVWPGMTADGPGVRARLWLAAATATALRAGLDLLGVDAPDRL
jgi:arginyl-tRNA synthetase